MFTRDELIAVARAKPQGGALPMRFPGAAVDSRLVQQGQLFVALRGEHADGYNFIPAALDAGAAGVLCARPHEAATTRGVGQIVVRDPLEVLQHLAQERLARQPQTMVIGITGSAGKTTTKDAVASLLSHLAPTLRTPASYNTETGLPMTVLGLEPEHRYAVLELGAQWVGEIAMLCRIAPPKIGIVTLVGGAHLEMFGSIENVERAKSELVRALPEDGVAILNADDRRVRRMARKTKARVVTFGRHATADVRALRISGDPLQGLRFTLIYGEQQARVHLNIPGQHAVSTALAAGAAALSCGMSIEAVAAALGELRVPKRRGEIKSGAGGITVIDDSYNANRQSMEAALDMIHGAKASKTARRWAVLGDMFELGRFAEEEHAAVGRHVARTADELVAVGSEARHIASAAVAAGMLPEHVHFFEADVRDVESVRHARDAAAALVLANARLSDMVLVKGSLGMGMDSVVSQLTSDLHLDGETGMRGRGTVRAQATASTLADLGLVRQPRR